MTRRSCFVGISAVAATALYMEAGVALADSVVAVDIRKQLPLTGWTVALQALLLLAPWLFAFALKPWMAGFFDLSGSRDRKAVRAATMAVGPLPFLVLLVAIVAKRLPGAFPYAGFAAVILVLGALASWREGRALSRALGRPEGRMRVYAFASNAAWGVIGFGGVVVAARVLAGYPEILGRLLGR
jgi:hypothetical protein